MACQARIKNHGSTELLLSREHARGFTVTLIFDPSGSSRAATALRLLVHAPQLRALSAARQKLLHQARTSGRSPHGAAISAYAQALKLKPETRPAAPFGATVAELKDMAPQQQRGSKRKTGPADIKAEPGSVPASIKPEPVSPSKAHGPVGIKAEPATPSVNAEAQPAVKAEPLSTDARRGRRAKNVVKKEDRTASKKEEQPEAKLGGWADEAAAAARKVKTGDVDLGTTPLAAPLGPFPDFKRPLPDECQVRTYFVPCILCAASL